ncbi:MAG: response regulator transcription factor [Planctomycetota bacterium]
MNKHILVVEDEKHIGVGVKYNLEAEGYRVTWVEDGASALRTVTRLGEDLNLIILDLMLPGMSGYAVCEALRDGGIDLPILMLSARTLAEDRTRGFDVGANQYMSKPFDLDELLSRVKNLLGSKRVASVPKTELPETAEFGRVKVNFESHEVMIDGKSIRMTPKELRLLQYFIANAERVIPREELLREVWDMRGNVQTRAVDQFIARLRKAIEEDSSEPRHLLTIRDAGYRFIKFPQPSDE